MLNKEIWSLAHSVQRATDAALREIQLDLVKTVFPIVRAMDTLYKEKDSLASANFDPIEMIKNLGDAVAFAGNVNLNLIKRRKETLKPHLPVGLQKNLWFDRVHRNTTVRRQVPTTGQKYKRIIKILIRNE